jgi:hypothetical protein
VSGYSVRRVAGFGSHQWAIVSAEGLPVEVLRHLPDGTTYCAAFFRLKREAVEALAQLENEK